MKDKIVKAIKLLLYRKPHVHLSVSYVSADNRYAGKTVMVTGATSGIGLAITKAFLAEGASVIMCARSRENYNAIKDSLDGNLAKFLQMDISKIDTLEGKISEASSIMGKDIDVFVNAAGVSAYDEDCMTEKMYDYICDINTKGLFYMNKFEGDYLISKGIPGKIVNITSKSGERIAFDPYTLSKWGANSITRGNARRLAPYHINVNGIAPGRVPTNITKELQCHIGSDDVYTENNAIQRFTMPEEVAQTALFLASGAANSIVGQIIAMDGGSYL